MDLLASVPSFVAAVLLVSATPGPAMALILRRASLMGRRAAMATVLGLEAGLFVWALTAGVGFAALVAASQAGFLVLRVVGALVLLAFGLRSLRAAWRLRRNEAPDAVPSVTGPHRGRGWLFGEGLLVQLANPKAAVFLLALYPQFVPAGRPVLATTAMLAVVQVTIETALYAGLAAGIGRAGGWFRRTAVRRRLEAATGGVLLALGLRVGLTSR
ncbi:MAG: LysE family translocator [Dermatophilaceae bacterium]